MIELYEFGRIVVNGKEYTSDLFIFTDRVKEGWCRKEGHGLHIEDLEEVFQEVPEVLVVGTGYLGLMKVPAETRKQIGEKGVDLVTQPTSEAWKTFNDLIKAGKKAVAAFHLTC